jgi:hypothetical protein
MNIKILTSTLAVSALALAALAPSAQAALRPGNYSIAGIQSICLVSDGSWYGETFSSWGGFWKAGPTRDDATVLEGTYNSGAGEDTMVLTAKSVDWTEFHNDRTFVAFVDSTVSRIRGACTAPAAMATNRKNPID